MRKIPTFGWLLAGLISTRIAVVAIAIVCAAHAFDSSFKSSAGWWALGLLALSTVLMLCEKALPDMLRARVERTWRAPLARANLSLELANSSAGSQKPAGHGHPGHGHPGHGHGRPPAPSVVDDAALVQAATQSAEKASTYTVTYLGPLVAAGLAPICVLFIVGTFLSWPIAGLLAATTVLVPILIRWAISSLRYAGAGYGRASGQLAQSFLAGVRSLRAALILNATTQRRDHIAALAEKMRTTVMGLLYRNQVMILVTDGAFGLATMTVAATCAFLEVQRGEFTIAEAIALVLLAQLLIEPVNDMGRTFYTGAAGKHSLTSIQQLLTASPKTPLPPAAPMPTAPTAASVSVENLSVRRGKDTVIDQISFHVPAGGHLAIVGPSGAGKSSLLMALAGLIPATGRVLINDAATDAAQLSSTSCYVPQTPTTFSGTVASNVDLARRGATGEDIEQALGNAALELEPTRLIDERHGLSGGQVARLALARGFLAQRNIILLDEPTANLDHETAKLVRQAAKDSGSTIIEITHRLSEARDADQILTLRAGRIADTEEFLRFADKAAEQANSVHTPGEEAR